MAKIKPVRVNLSTKPEEIIATMREEIDGEDYQFRKKYGGRRKYEQYEDKMVDDALINRQSSSTELNEHISKVGNRWITYTHVEYYPKAIYAQAYHMSFIYYETYGSCGAFFPMYDPDKSKNRKKNGSGLPTGVVIFTSHFFLRMSERTGKAYRSKELIQEFISTKNEGGFQTDEDGDVIVKFKGGYGFGKEKSKNPTVIEVRTFLTDEQLTPAQRRKVERLDAFSTLMANGAYIDEVALCGAIQHANDPLDVDSYKETAKAIEKLGLGVSMAMVAGIAELYCELVSDILGMKLSNEQKVIMIFVAAKNSRDFVQKWEKISLDGSLDEKVLNGEAREDTIDLMCRFAKVMNLKSVNRDTISERIDDVISRLNEQKEV